jgi:hypothetical protein
MTGDLDHDPHTNDPCLRCGQWIRLGPDAHRNENPRWCAECNFTQQEFLRLRVQDEVLGQPVRTKEPPKSQAAQRKNYVNP